MNSSAPSIDTLSRATLPTAAARAKPRLSQSLQWRLFVLDLIGVDAVMLGAAFYLAYSVRFTLPVPLFQLDVEPSLQYYQLLTLFITPVWLCILAMSGLYKRQHLLGGTEEYALVFRSTMYGLVVIVFVGFLEHGLVIARAWLLLAGVFSFLLVALGRFGLRRLAYVMRGCGYFLSAAVIVGANDEGRRLAEQLLDGRYSGLSIMGFVDEKVPAGTLVLRHLATLGNVEQLGEIIRQYGVTEVILAASAISTRNNLVEIFRRYGISNEVTMRLSSGLYEIITTGLTIAHFAYTPLVSINKARLTGADRLLKLALDYGLAIPGLLLTWPLYFIIAVAVKIDSPGPMFHRRRVMGVNGKQFDAFKFRTMHVNGEAILAAHPELQAELARNHKLKNDPRITRVGSVLRKLSLDELPQVFNVIRGEMSLVGPRMISPDEVIMYNRWDINLLTVKPGITGLWQVSGRSDISYEERVRLDMFYIRNWTIWSDIQLLVQTIPAVIRGHGAY
jgi:exopolysaccharide biosynthesis polyprenyl glycosylphosphotransferase